MNSRAFFLASPFALLLMLAPAVHAEPIVGLTSDNRLLTFDSLSPGTITNTATITGLQAGESLVGIDLRPRNGTIYGLGRSATGAASIYTLAAGTGVATRIAGLTANPADPTNPFSSLQGTAFGVDFNPVPDTTDAATGSFRVTSESGFNYRVNANNGQVFTDTNLDYTDSTRDPRITAVAYSNNFFGATTTTLRGVDSADPDILATFTSPNDGTLTVGNPPITLPFDTSDLAGYDVSQLGGIFFSATAPAPTRRNCGRTSAATSSTGGPSAAARRSSTSPPRASCPSRAAWPSRASVSPSSAWPGSPAASGPPPGPAESPPEQSLRGRAGSPPLSSS